jgi:hypothetical protein
MEGWVAVGRLLSLKKSLKKVDLGEKEGNESASNMLIFLPDFLFGSLNTSSFFKHYLFLPILLRSLSHRAILLQR